MRGKRRMERWKHGLATTFASSYEELFYEAPFQLEGGKLLLCQIFLSRLLQRSFFVESVERDASVTSASRHRFTTKKSTAIWRRAW